MSYINNNKNCELVSLITNSYEFKFYFSHPKEHKNIFFSTEVEFLLNSTFPQKIHAKSSKFMMKLNDLEDLISYLRNHINNLQVDPHKESYTFTDYGLMYQIQASCGFISSNIEESYFSIISMVNIGRNNVFKDSTYIGGESTINIKQVENFIDSLENLVSKNRS